jgi:hypothetical protein
MTRDVNTNTQRRKGGRPKTGLRFPFTIGLRVNERERDLIQHAAQKRGVNVSNWLREVVMPIAHREAA